MKKLVIHIGTPKTGTSTLQRILLNNCNALFNEGILYPFDPKASGYGLERCANGAILQPEYFDSSKLQPQFDSWFATSSTVVLSEEVLFLNDNLKMLHHLRNDQVEIAVLAFFRNGADYLSSLWMEFNRFENRTIAPPLEEFMQGRAYLRSIGNLLTLIQRRPEYTFNCQPYHPKNHPESSVVQALNYLNADIDVTSAETVNESMSRVEADIRQLALRERWTFSENLNSMHIRQIAYELDSGDFRPVIETLSDETIDRVCADHYPFLNQVMAMTGSSERRFDHVRPSCFEVTRDIYHPIDVSEHKKIKERLLELSLNH